MFFTRHQFSNGRVAPALFRPSGVVTVLPRFVHYIRGDLAIVDQSEVRSVRFTFGTFATYFHQI